MRIKDYIRGLQQKPEHQRERIAVIATAVSFLIILVIWLVTFSEMNGDKEPESASPADTKLQDIESGVKEGKKSIEEMWNQVPSQDVLPGNNGTGGASGLENGNGSGDGGNVQSGDKEATDGEIPKLP